MEHLQYPIGRFTANETYTERQTKTHIQILADYHGNLKTSVMTLTPQQLNTNTLAQTIAFYAWHCQHHYAHLKLLTKIQP